MLIGVIIKPVRWHDRYFPRKYNPVEEQESGVRSIYDEDAVTDALNWESCTIQNTHHTIVIDIRNEALDNMKEEYPDATKFNTP